MDVWVLFLFFLVAHRIWNIHYGRFLWTNYRVYSKKANIYFNIL